MVKNKVKEIREAQGLSQEQLAVKSCVPRSTIGDIENGMHAPTLEAAMRIAEALGAQIEALFRLVK